MKLGSLASARPAYYDRNATSTGSAVTATVAPHGFTTRSTLTIASGKKANIESAAVYVIQLTAATTIGRRFGIVRITDTSANTYDIARVDGTSSVTLNVSASSVMNGQPTIYAGETVKTFTEDDGVGGTIDYVLHAKATLYDV